MMRTGNGYRAILFDLDGTLRLSPHSPVRLFFEFCADLGLTFDDQDRARLERWQHAYWADWDQVNSDMESGRETFWLDYNRKQLRFLGLTGDLEPYVAELDRRFRAVFAEDASRVPEDVRPTLEQLRQAGYTLGLVSNRFEPLTDVVAELDLTDLFDFTLAAGEVNSWKPHPGIFVRAVDLAQSTPTSTVYVGDNYYADVIGARSAGLTPLLIDRDSVFPDADCDRITKIGEIQEWLERNSAGRIH